LGNPALRLAQGKIPNFNQSLSALQGAMEKVLALFIVSRYRTLMEQTRDCRLGRAVK
jgi:hypothetical protein